LARTAELASNTNPPPSTIQSSPLCLGRLSLEGSGCQLPVNACALGGAHTIAYHKVQQKSNNLGVRGLEKCVNFPYGCKAQTYPDRLERFHFPHCHFKSQDCPNAVYGCAEEGLRGGEFERHLPRCRFKPVECHHCNRNVPMSFYTKHVEIECGEVVEACALCSEGVKRRDIERHCEECPARIVSCANRCTFSCKFGAEGRELEVHEKKECPRRVVACHYCNRDARLNFMDTHLECCEVKNKPEEEEKASAEENEEEEMVASVIKLVDRPAIGAMQVRSGGRKKSTTAAAPKPKRTGGGYKTG